MTGCSKEEENNRCNICSSNFKDGLSLDLHIKKKHTKNTICKICGLVLKNKNHYQRHLSEHKDTKKFICKTCKKSYKRNCHLKRHELKH